MGTIPETPLTYGSVCSGIGSEVVAWGKLGWRCRWFSEVDQFCCRLLTAKYPKVKNVGSFTAVNPADLEPVDVLVGGTPCQSFSLNSVPWRDGTRKGRQGLDDERGQLTVHFLSAAASLKPRWVVWENTVGALSADGGRAFGTVLWALEECGYGWAYRVLDLRGFGVPQRRRRLFVVGCLGGSEPAFHALFNSPTDDEDRRPTEETQARSLVGAADGWSGDETPKRIANACPTLKRSQGGEGVGVMLRAVPNSLRKLTTLEWERLQGFPDHYTRVLGASDKQRQMALGNAFPPPMLRYVGGGIAAVESTV